MGPSNSANQNGTHQSIFESLDADDFVKHPNYHIFAPFFAGFVFCSSLCYIACSPFFRYVLQLGRRTLIPRNYRGWKTRVSQVSDDTEAQMLGRSYGSEKGQARQSVALSITESIYRRGENPTLIFALTLLFLMSSLSQFLSTLTLGSSDSSSSASSLCAFLVAWDAMSSQFARLLGLFIIGLVFRTLLTNRWETWAYWGVLATITVLVFVTNALSTGTVKSTKDVGVNGFAVNLCYRRHFLPTSIAVSLLSLFTEAYSIFRLLFIIAPPSFPLQRRLDALIDVRILRIASLVLFDMITMVPNAINTSFAGDTVPYSIAALIVLYAFNSLHNLSDFILQELPHTEIRTVALVAARNPSLRQTRPASIEIGDLYMSRHPFSAMALENNASQQDIWRTARISGLTQVSNASTHVARSVRDAVVQTATRENFTPSPILPYQPAPRRQSKSKYRSSGQTKSSSSGSSRSASLKRRLSSPLVKPIIPKSELAKKVSDNFGEPPARPTNVLAPPPPRPRPPPPQPPPPLPIDTSKKYRPLGTADSAPGTARSLYGSDIIRPKSGQRDKMKYESPRSNGSSGGSVASSGTTGTTRKASSKSVETIRASGISARTVDTHRSAGTSGTVAFGGNEWPLPPNDPIPPLPPYSVERTGISVPSPAKVRTSANSPTKRAVGLPSNPRTSPPRPINNLPGSAASPKRIDHISQTLEALNTSRSLPPKLVSPPRPTKMVRGPRPPPSSPGMISRFSGWTESDVCGLEDRI